MASILTLDEINLLKNSEEPKNTELYGNLYQILCEITKPKAVSLEDLPRLDNKGVAALTFNKSNLINAVIKEWYAERVGKEDPTQRAKCGLCNTPNKYIFYIRNRKNNILLNVGSYCITKFPDIEGYVEQKQSLKEIKRQQDIIKRRTDFHNSFPDADKYIKSADNFFSEFPILLPYDIYTELDSIIKRMRLIYSMYINEGKSISEDKLTPFKSFRQSSEEFEQLKAKAEVHKDNYKNKPLVCKRREINWMLAQEKDHLLKQISENNGVYSSDTLKQMIFVDFVEENLPIFESKNLSKYFKLEGLRDNSLVFSFKKSGYQNPVLFEVKISDFMFNIGANCLVYKKYTYSDKKIEDIAKIIDSTDNLSIIIDSIYSITEKFNCIFLYDYDTNSLILYRKSDKAIRNFKPSDFLKQYNKYMFLSDKEIEKYLSFVIKGGNTPARWITRNVQEKQGIDAKISKLYREQR